MIYTYSDGMKAVIKRLIADMPKVGREAVWANLHEMRTLRIGFGRILLVCGSTTDLPDTVSFSHRGNPVAELDIRVMPRGKFLPVGTMRGTPLEGMTGFPPEGVTPRGLLDPRIWHPKRQPELRAALAAVLGL